MSEATTDGGIFGSEKRREKGLFLLRKFLAACDLAYRRSKKRSLPDWVANFVDCTLPDDIAETPDTKSASLSLSGFWDTGDTLISGWKVGAGDPSIVDSVAWSALLRLRPLQEFWRLELRENHRVRLTELLAETWIIDPAPVPPHAVIPGLGIQDWRVAPTHLSDGRGAALYTRDESGQTKVIWGPETDPSTWTEEIERALSLFQQDQICLLQALPDHPAKAKQQVLG